MTMLDTINTILAGGLLGTLGQGVRTTVGLKKFNEENTAKALSNSGASQEQFSVSRMVISLFIGFVAGALGMLVKGYDAKKDLETESIVTIIAIGYSGADFIEGVFNTYIKKAIPATTATDAGAAGNSANSQPLTVPDEANFTNNPAQG